MEKELKAIEEKVASEEMQEIQDLDDLVTWFDNFGNLRIDQLEQVKKDYPDSKEIIDKCNLAIHNIRQIQSFMPE